ncbi:MAG: HAD family hydrolase [candidate division KSB1 bacterium]|nr:HAD family hydrolase [candidate division KSB1 bacterium]
MAPKLKAFDTANATPNIFDRGQNDDDATWQTLRREVKAISLDLWGTILDDRHPPSDTVIYSEQRQNFLRDVLRDLGYEFSPEQMRAAYHQAWRYFDALWEQQIAFGAEEGVREMLRFLNAELPPDYFQRVKKFFEETPIDATSQAPPAFDGALDAIHALAKTYPLALISDTAWTPGRVLRQIFAYYDILDCFRVLLFSDEIGVTKPHPKIFHLALKALGVTPAACLHVGDLQRTDIAGAKALGMRAAWISRPVYAGHEQKDHGPDVVVSGVAEVAKKLLSGCSF